MNFNLSVQCSCYMYLQWNMLRFCGFGDDLSPKPFGICVDGMFLFILDKAQYTAWCLLCQ